MTYHFRITKPGERVTVAIEGRDAEGKLISAAYVGRRRELTDTNLLLAFATRPLLAGQVLGAIHWEALKLWHKGVRLRTRPPPPKDSVSVVHDGRAAEVGP
jgi:DUF1365 family protein